MPGKPWTKEELWLVEEGYSSPLISKEDLMDMLPGRSWAGITAQASRQGLSRPAEGSWTEEEIELVLEAYCDPKRGPQWLEKELDRTPGAINIKAFKLGVVVDIAKKQELKAREKLKDTEYKLLEYKVQGKSLVRHIPCGHEWRVRVANLAYYVGCPKCSIIGNRKNTKTFYLIFFPALDVYKVGRTGNLDARLRAFGETPEVIDTIVFETAEECEIYEKAALKKLKHHKYNTGRLISGNTETFSWDGSRSDLKIFLDNLI